MALKPFFLGNQKRDPDEDVLTAPLAGTRAEAMQRLQVGFFGLVAMILLIGLANVIMNRAQQAEDEAVPDAAPTVAVDPEPSPQSDPLSEAGVVPELPADPEPAEAGSAGPEGQIPVPNPNPNARRDGEAQE